MFGIKFGSPWGSPVPGILQARTLVWVAISFSIVWKWKVKVKSLSPVWLLATQWIAAYKAPPSMGFSRQEYWSVEFILKNNKGCIKDLTVRPEVNIGGNLLDIKLELEIFWISHQKQK